METLSFAFGVLTMFAVILVIAVVVGIVKVYKQGNQIINLENALRDFEQGINQHVNSNVDDIHRTIGEVERELNTQSNELRRELDKRFDISYNNITQIEQELYRKVYSIQTELTAYTDARIDKLDAKLSSKPEKQLLKN